MCRCGELRHVFNSSRLSLPLKIRLYVASVCSLLIYGSESWTLDDKTQRRLNGVNARMLSSFSGKKIQEEARPQSCSHNILLQIRKIRLRWLGHILRCPSDRLIQHAVKAQHSTNHPGNLLMDAPPHDSLDHLIALAQDREGWRQLVRALT